MRQSARQLEEPSGLGALLREGLVLSTATIMRNPLAVGGTTAFLVALGFISANALWYQPHFHEGAFFSTRTPAVATEISQSVPQPEPEATALPSEAAPAPQLLERAPAPDNQVTQSIEPQQNIEPQQPAFPGDSKVARVQSILKGLELYQGEVDGITGPQTGAAIKAYQRIVGLEQTGEINEALLAQLGIVAEPAAAGQQQMAALPAPEATPETLPVPEPRPRPRSTAEQPSIEPVYQPDPQVVRIQAGLRAFGNDGIELDGKVGERTRQAIEEFQALFGLPVTGEPDEITFAKMREIGLTN
jgi:peptidoglycan hydrolase-like protein with peptidoglycan-binding domain